MTVNLGTTATVDLTLPLDQNIANWSIGRKENQDAGLTQDTIDPLPREGNRRTEDIVNR